MKRYGPLLVALAVVAVFAYATYESQTWSTRSRTFGIGVAAVGLALSAANLGREALRLRRPADPSADPGALGTAIRLPSVAWAAAFFASIWAVGLLYTVPVYAIAYLRGAARTSWPFAVGYAIVASVFIYAVFVSLLHIRLPTGALFGGPAE